MPITYRTDVTPPLKDILALYHHSGYFPIHDQTDVARIEKMHAHANLLVTAWDDATLVGLARSLCDFCYCCYLSDLCVHDDHKATGIGQELVRLTKQAAGEECKLLLHSSPEAAGFYVKIGMQPVATAFVLPRSR
jgi:GNAT superfamily N-acetyltransferase